MARFFSGGFPFFGGGGGDDFEGNFIHITNLTPCKFEYPITLIIINVSQE